MKSAGASDAEVQAALRFDPRGIGLSVKEQALFDFSLRANGDPHSMTREDIDTVKRAGATDGPQGVRIGVSLAGLLGGGITLVVALALAWIVRRRGTPR
jgi:hypothetical protein